MNSTKLGKPEILNCQVSSVLAKRIDEKCTRFLSLYFDQKKKKEGKKTCTKLDCGRLKVQRDTSLTEILTATLFFGPSFVENPLCYLVCFLLFRFSFCLIA